MRTQQFIEDQATVNCIELSAGGFATSLHILTRTTPLLSSLPVALPEVLCCCSVQCDQGPEGLIHLEREAQGEKQGGSGKRHFTSLSLRNQETPPRT